MTDPRMTPTNDAPVTDDDGPCTTCDDTGITIQTERTCSCDAGDQYRPKSDAPVTVEQCSCMEVHGENPNCPVHGWGTAYERANVSWDDLAAQRAEWRDEWENLHARLAALASAPAERFAIGIDGSRSVYVQNADGSWPAVPTRIEPASAPAGDGYGKWHPMLLDIVNAIHGDRGEKTQAIGIDLSYQQALAAALARPRAAVGERSREWWTLEWIAAPRPPVHMKPMRGSQDFDTAEAALAFWRGKPADSTYVGLTRHVQTSTLQSPPAEVEG